MISSFNPIRLALVTAALAATAVAPAGAATVVPNDELFPRQWSLQNADDHDIDAPAAWSQRTSCGTVAVLDTGADLTHPELVPNLWTNPDERPGNGKDDDHNGYVDDVHGVDVRTGGPPTDTNGHGTHVAGLIGARGNDVEGTTGVCWKAKLMVVKFMSVFGQGQAGAAARGIDYAVKQGAKVINCSFGTSSASGQVHDAIRRAKDKGVLVVVAAGNDGQDIDKHPVYPAAWTDANIVSVAASTQDDKLASFSNRGAKGVDVAAPGADMLSTYLHGRYATLSGTSMAAPLVAASAGMVRRQDTDLSPKAIRNLLRKKADKPKALAGKTVHGGRLNLRKAVAAAG